MTRQEIRKLIIKALTELHEGAQINQILEKVRLQYPEIHKRTALRCLRELIDDGTVKVTGYYVYSIRDKTKLRAGIFQQHSFINLWSALAKGPKGQGDQTKLVNLVEMFGVYMTFCFLETARTNRYIRSYEDRIELLLSMIDLIDLKYGMYYKFIELLRYGGSKTFPVLSEFENKDSDTLDLDEKTIAKWFQRLKEQYPTLVKPLESSLETARGIVK